MKLLYVIHQYFPECHSGTEQYCLAVSREARRRGDEVVVLSLDPHVWRDDPPLVFEDRPYDDFPVWRLRHWQGLSGNDLLLDSHNPLVAHRFAEFLREQRPEAIHFFHLRRLGADLLRAADRVEGIPRPRIVVNLMDFWYLCPRFTLQRSDGSLCEGPPDGGLGCIACEYPDLAEPFGDPRLAEIALRYAASIQTQPQKDSATARFVALMQRKPRLLAQLARADAVIAPSRFLAEMFRSNGFDSERMTVVPYGLEPGRVKRLPVERPRSPLRVGFAGVLSPWKAPDVAVRALRQVRGAIQLTVHGRTEEGMFQAYIDETRAAADGDERILFPGAFGEEQLDQVMADLDLLVVPSLWYENTPFVILEAFEAGVPVIASDLGGMAEVVEPGVNGYLFPAGDVDALAALLQDLVDRPEQLRALRPAPIGTVQGNYDCFAPLYRGETSPDNRAASSGSTRSAE